MNRKTKSTPKSPARAPVKIETGLISSPTPTSHDALTVFNVLGARIVPDVGAYSGEIDQLFRVIAITCSGIAII